MCFCLSASELKRIFKQIHDVQEEQVWAVWGHPAAVTLPLAASCTESPALLTLQTPGSGHRQLLATVLRLPYVTTPSPPEPQEAEKRGSGAHSAQGETPLLSCHRPLPASPSSSFLGGARVSSRPAQHRPYATPAPGPRPEHPAPLCARGLGGPRPAGS